MTAEPDLAEITRGKYDFDATGHYARPDVFRLLVNETARPAVTFLADPPTREHAEQSSVVRFLDSPAYRGFGFLILP